MGVWIETRSRYRQLHNHRVTPYVGVWIETVSVGTAHFPACVTPYVGVWIETRFPIPFSLRSVSLLMWECGLKQVTAALRTLDACHSLCGSVD